MLAVLLAFIVLLLITVVVALQIPAVQQKVAQQAARYVSNTIKSQFSIGSFTTDWRHAVVLEDVLLLNRQQDTLIYSQHLGLDLAIFSLLQGKLSIDRASLSNASVDFKINEDGSTNFDYIINAFSNPADTSSAMEISLSDVALTNVRFAFSDAVAGNKIKTTIGHVASSFQEFDLDKQRFIAENSELQNTFISILQTKLPPPSEPETLSVFVDFGEINLQKVTLDYKSTASDQTLYVAVDKGKLVANEIDLPNALVNLEQVAIDGAIVKYAQQKFTPKDSLSLDPIETAKSLTRAVEKTKGKSIAWNIEVEDLAFKNVTGTFDNFNIPVSSKGLDYNHVQVQNAELLAEDFKLEHNNVSALIKELKAKEQKGFQLKHLQTELMLDSAGLSLKDLQVSTNKSDLNASIQLAYPAVTEAINNPEKVTVSADFSNSTLALQEIGYLAPMLYENPQFANIAHTKVRVEGGIKGNAQAFNFQNLKVNGLSGTQINASGQVRNVLQPDKLYAQLRINRFASNKTDVQALIPGNVLPPNLNLPQNFAISGTFQGSLASFNTSFALHSSAGLANATIYYGGNLKPFTVDISTKQLNIASLWKQDLGIGEVTARLKANGTGSTLQNMQANYSLAIESAVYNQYPYSQIEAEGKLLNGNLTAALTSADPNLRFAGNVEATLKEEAPFTYKIDLNLQGANLEALHVYTEPLSVAGNFKADFKGTTTTDLSGSLQGNAIALTHSGKTSKIDSLQLAVAHNNGGTQITLASDAANGFLNTENDLGSFVVAATKHFSNYFDLQPDPPYPANTALKSFDFSVTLKKPAILYSFVPGLTALSVSGPITGKFNGATKELALNGNINQLEYNGYAAKGLTIKGTGSEQEILFDIKAKQITGNSLALKNVSLSALAKDKELAVNLHNTDDKGKKQYALAGSFFSQGPGYHFKFKPEPVILNYQNWQIASGHDVQFSSTLLYIHNLVFSAASGSLSLNSSGPVTKSAPLTATFQNFELHTASQLFSNQDSLFSGKVNGTVTLTNILSGSPGLTSALTITNAAYSGKPIGNLALNASKASDINYRLQIALTENGNDVQFSGTYLAKANDPALNGLLTVQKLNLQSLQGFMADLLPDLSGIATGNLNVGGTLVAPVILGKLVFNNTKFSVAGIKSVYSVNDQVLNFTSKGIELDNFTLMDIDQNKAVVNGALLTQNYTEFTFDLKASTIRFLAVNSEAKDNNLYYGKVYASAELTMTGAQSKPIVRGKLEVLDGSDLTLVLPATASGAAQQEGVVEFVQFSDSVYLNSKSNDAAENPKGFVGFDILTDISITKVVPLKVIVDPLTGDNLKVKGDALLTAGIDPSGNISLYGRYTLSEGEYQLIFYDLVTRKLSLIPGGYAQWNGNPLTGDLVVTAVYKTRAAPSELVANEIGSLEQGAQGNYRTPMPFNVYVNLEGKISAPDITFDVQLAENSQSTLNGQIEAKLAVLRQDRAELNKQVFALLVLGRFIAEDPLAGGGGLSSSARSSIAQVLSDELNKLTNEFAGGLGLELGVNSYQDQNAGATQGRTDLNVALRQQVLNNRVEVKLGGDIGLEGQRRQQNTMSNFGGDISVEYSITPDGRLRLRGFRRNRYQGLLEGDVQETGMSLIFVRDYDNFSDLFRSLESRNKHKAARLGEERRKFKKDAKQTS